MNSAAVIHKEQINDTADLTVLEYQTLSPELVDILDEHLVHICEGEHSTSSISDVKRRIVELFAGKEAKDGAEYSNWEMGAVAEIFIHLYIKTIGLKQECMFLNLEDRSAKKGFDGYYTDPEDHWIMESKSGSTATGGISHGSKLKEAMKDLQGKFSGTGTKNNPWREAYNHASHIDVSTAEDIRVYIKSLAKEFTEGIFHNSSEFNIIPCATLYYDDMDFTEKNLILEQANGVLGEVPYLRAHFICVSSKSVKIFKQYLGLQ